MNQGEATDPIKRAELIREIVHSVALIPDQITRTVYLQQIAKQFDISEQIVSNELIKQRKQAVSKQLQEPEIAALPFEKQLEPAPQTSEKNREEENLNAVCFSLEEMNLIEENVIKKPVKILVEMANKVNRSKISSRSICNKSFLKALLIRLFIA